MSLIIIYCLSRGSTRRSLSRLLYLLLLLLHREYINYTIRDQGLILNITLLQSSSLFYNHLVRLCLLQIYRATQLLLLYIRQYRLQLRQYRQLALFLEGSQITIILYSQLSQRAIGIASRFFTMFQQIIESSTIRTKRDYYYTRCCLGSLRPL